MPTTLTKTNKNKPTVKKMIPNVTSEDLGDVFEEVSAAEMAEIASAMDKVQMEQTGSQENETDQGAEATATDKTLATTTPPLQNDTVEDREEG